MIYKTFHFTFNSNFVQNFRIALLGSTFLVRGKVVASDKNERNSRSFFFFGIHYSTLFHKFLLMDIFVIFRPIIEMVHAYV